MFDSTNNIIKKQNDEVEKNAAVIIQSVWRGVRVRKLDMIARLKEEKASSISNFENCSKNRTMVFSRHRGWENLEAEFGNHEFSDLENRLKILNETNKDKKNSCSVLEVGCGKGNATDDLALKYKNISFHGMDLGDEPYRRGNGKLLFSYQKGDVQSLNYASDTFDVVYSAATMPYVHDKVKGLLEIHRVLKPGGVAVIACDPNYFGPQAEKLFPDSGSDITWSANKQNLVIEKKGRGLPCEDYIFISPLREKLNNNYYSEYKRYYDWPKTGEILWQKWNQYTGKRDNPYKGSIVSMYVEKDMYFSSTFEQKKFHDDFWDYDKYPEERKKSQREIKKEELVIEEHKRLREKREMDGPGMCNIM